jgi:hypothetical protein
MLWHAARNQGILNADIDREEVHRGLTLWALPCSYFWPQCRLRGQVPAWRWLLLVPISWLRFDVGGQTKV